MLDVAFAIAATGAEVLRIHPGGNCHPAELTRAELQSRLGSVTVDSRAIERGALFVALQGEHADGHAFVADALKAGAAAALVSRRPDLSAFAPNGTDPPLLFVVPNALRALQDLASAWRAALNPVVVGITGSIGKTTTKEILASVLSGHAPVLRNEANLNTEIGLPLTLMKLRPEHRVAALEMGMYVPGDIALLADIAKPDIGIVTTVAPIHLERCGSIERIARAKSELPASLPPSGLALLNGDNPWTRSMAAASGVAPAYLIGLGEDCDYRAVDVQALGLSGVAFRLVAEGNEFAVRTNVPGAHTVHAFLFAAAVARRLGMSWDDIIAAIGATQLEARQHIVQVSRGITLIDDAYNAAPESMRAALDVLASGPGQKVAVLGDMLELGPAERDAHHDVGNFAAGTVDWLVTRGARARWIAEAARDAGLPARRIVSVDTNAEAAEAVMSILGAVPVGAAPGEQYASRTMHGSPRDSSLVDADGQWTVLVKGSNGMKMKDVVDALRGEYL